jgi:predicted CoA-binding protein
MNNGYKTIVLGASPNPTRYSHLAVLRLAQYEFEVKAVGTRKGTIGGISIEFDFSSEDNAHTITLYMNPTRQKPLYEKIIAANPERIIFNPGTENPELIALAKSHKIETVEACTLVMLSTGQYCEGQRPITF